MRALLLGISGLALLSTAEAAVAASCLDEVARLADRYELKTPRPATIRYAFVAPSGQEPKQIAVPKAIKLGF